MKVYLASPYTMKDEMIRRRDQLVGLGIGVTSTWLTEDHGPGTQLAELTPTQHRFYAERDTDDVIQADVFVLNGVNTLRQGHNVEFGMALIINKLVRPMPILAVGDEYLNIFHYMPGVVHVPDWNHAVQWLVGYDLDRKMVASWTTTGDVPSL